MSWILGTIEEDQQYYNEMLAAIRQVMVGQLQEMESTFQAKFQKLEEEIRGRDQIIIQLRSHIVELEKAADDSFTVRKIYLSAAPKTYISGLQRNHRGQTSVEPMGRAQLPRNPGTATAPSIYVTAIFPRIFPQAQLRARSGNGD